MGDPTSTKIPPAKRDRPLSNMRCLQSRIVPALLLGFLTVYEFSLRAGLRFPPSSELIDILQICGVSLSQLSYRDMSIIMEITEQCCLQNAFLGWVILSVIRRVVSLSDLSGWIFILGIHQKAGLGKLKDLPIPLHIGEEDLLKMLSLPDFENHHYEVLYLSRYADEEYLFKVGLSIQAGRSHARMLKKSVKVPEVAIQPSKAPPK
ncbi:hypothetical protein M5K25_024334 [Dendrobium thyrsiflorum]|uniref:Uncharacterized protein n=1 Tax=Dendrobium thyrsiflorum TaxID=117978 RepID=A0ABD0U1N2_DENTH